MKPLLIGLGGFVGSVLRYGISGLAQGAWPGAVFPVGTLVVNVLGCLVLGAISELVEARGFLSPEARLFLVVGLLGGFTTFSAFANETLNAVRDGAIALALTNVGLNLVACLAAVWGGRSLAALLWR